MMGQCGNMIVFMNSAAARLMTTDTEYSVVISGLISLSSKAECSNFQNRVTRDGLRYHRRPSNASKYGCVLKSCTPRNWISRRSSGEQLGETRQSFAESFADSGPQ